MADRIVETFSRSELQQTTLPMVCVYERPDDYPDVFVARLWDGRRPTNMVAMGQTLAEVRRARPFEMVTIPRISEDNNEIVEMWIF